MGRNNIESPAEQPADSGSKDIVKRKYNMGKSKFLEARNKYLDKAQTPAQQASSRHFTGEGIGLDVSEQIQNQMQALSKQKRLVTQQTRTTAHQAGPTLITMLTSNLTQTQTDTTSNASGKTLNISKKLLLNKRFPASRPRLISTTGTNNMLSNSSAMQSVLRNPRPAGQTTRADLGGISPAKKPATKNVKRSQG